jgi:hypothetical protein
MVGDGDSDGSSVLLSAVEDAAATVARLQALVGDDVAWRSTDREVLAAVGDVARLRSALDAVHLGLVRQVVSRGVAEASPVATSPEGFLRTACLSGATQARRDVEAARATAPGAVLEPFAGLLAEGRCTREHVDRAVRVMDLIPVAVRERPGAGQQIVDYMLLAATEAAPLDMARAGRHLLAVLPEDPDSTQGRVDRQAHQRRFLDMATDETGMLVGRFQLDPVAGAALRTAVQRWSGPESGADGERDTRQPRQRRADALSALVETALGVEHPRRGERPRVVVQVTPEQLLDAKDRLGGTVTGMASGMAEVEGGGPLPGWAVRRLACDAVLQRIVFSPTEGPIELGRSERLASVTQRRVLAARDGACVVPGCGAPPDICDAHHVVHWADGGPTDLLNMCLLCPAHHTAVHAGTWAVSIDAQQQVTVTPPRWVDPLQRSRPAWYQRARRLRQDIHAECADPPSGGEVPDRPPDDTASWTPARTADVSGDGDDEILALLRGA